MHHLLPKLPLWLALLAIPATANAQETAAAPNADPSAVAVLQPSVTADLRGEYLQGFPILVTITVQNENEQAVSFPDLSSRPHLVHFDIVDSEGKKQSRFTTPPQQDTDLRWTLAPRTRRQVLLEIPSSGAMAAGSYTLQVNIQGEEAAQSPQPVTLKLVPPTPTLAHITWDGPAANQNGWMFPWIHRATVGFDIYLYQVSNQLPTARGHNYFLLHLSKDIHPWLAASRAQEGLDRHIYWQDEQNALAYTRLKSTTLRHAPRTVGVPYPGWELLARGTTDANGGLHVPIWIPAPKGVGGEVRVISIDDHGQATFRKVVRMAQHPDAASTVDAMAQQRLALLYDGKIDIYTLKTGPGVDLPAAGRRIFRPVPPEPESKTPASWTGLMFDSLPQEGDEPGGLALFAWRAADTATPGIEGAWFSFEGRQISTLPAATYPEGALPIQVVPRGYQDLALLWTTGDGRQGALLPAQGKTPIHLQGLDGTTVVQADGNGSLHRIQLLNGRGIQVVSLEPPAAPASGTPSTTD